MANYRDLYFKDVMFLDSWTCCYCGIRSRDLAIDHYLPQVKGGPDIIQNLVACCKSCNSRKGGRAPYECEMIARFGRFSYVTDWALDCVNENLDNYTTQIRTNAATDFANIIEKSREHGMADKLWQLGMIPTKEPPNSFQSFFLWGSGLFSLFCFLIFFIWGASYYPSVFGPLAAITLTILAALGMILARKLASVI